MTLSKTRPLQKEAKLPSIKRWLEERELLELVDVVHGTLPSPSELTLVTVTKDSDNFIDAFINHHRALGVKRFLVLDDWSRTDFLERLKSYGDVTVVRVPFRYHQKIHWIDSAGKKVSGIVGATFKDLISRHLTKYPWVLALDDDEFLVLSPGLRDLNHLFSLAHNKQWNVFASQMVDFMPRTWPPGPEIRTPNNLEELVKMYPLFKPEPSWMRSRGKLEWDRDCNAITDLFRLEKIYSGPFPYRLLKPLLARYFRRVNAFPRSDVSKVPIVGPSLRHLRKTAHSVPAKIDGPMVVAICHFTLTSGFREKVATYLRIREGLARHNSWSRYAAYSRLLTKMDSTGRRSFDDLSLVAYETNDSLVRAGILDPLDSLI